MKNRLVAFAFVLLVTGLGTGAALAHHGWAWTTGGNIELIGIITSVKLGNPHGVLKVDAEGDVWTVEVGQPWRNEDAGLEPGDLAEGVEIRVIGQPSVNIEDRLMKAERLYIGGVEYNLYPNRD
ncbi:MAG: DUF6152 family protein [Rhodospirillales bacterium]